MIKVVQVTSDSNIGGAGKCILTFLKNFDREQFDVSVILPKDSLLKPFMRELDIKTYEAEHIAEQSLSLKGINEMTRILKCIKPDIVHTHASMSARIAAQMCKVKTVYTRHSVFEPSKTISKGLGKVINGMVNNNTADCVIAVAEAAKQNLIETGVDPNKIKVILNGVDPLEKVSEAKLAKFKEMHNIDDDTKVVAIIARLTEVKGQKYFVKAARKIIERGIKAKFLIAGTGNTEKMLNEMISELKLGDDVKMLGFVEDVTVLMNAIDVQVNCSFGTEATSLSLLEGMSLGKPAVVTDFGGNSGVIKNGENGFLVPTHDVYALTDKLSELLTDEDLYNRMSETASKIYNERFTSQAYTREIEKVYLEML